MAKVLVVVSAAHVLQLKNGEQQPTGHFLGEVAEPLDALLQEGHDLTFASPGGGAPTIDKASLSHLYWFGNEERRSAALALVEAQPGWHRPEVLESLDDDRLAGFDALFVPGGHAPMADLAKSAAMGGVLMHFHNEHKPIGLICHAPTVLLSTATIEPWPFAGYRLTVFSELEEKIAETFFLKGDVPYYPSQALADHGATVDNSLVPNLPHVVVDRELVTGQNAYSPKAFAKAFVEALRDPATVQAPGGEARPDIGTAALKVMPI